VSRGHCGGRSSEGTNPKGKGYIITVKFAIIGINITKISRQGNRKGAGGGYRGGGGSGTAIKIDRSGRGLDGGQRGSRSRSVNHNVVSGRGYRVLHGVVMGRGRGDSGTRGCGVSRGGISIARGYGRGRHGGMGSSDYQIGVTTRGHGVRLYLTKGHGLVDTCSDRGIRSRRHYVSGDGSGIKGRGVSSGGRRDSRDSSDSRARGVRSSRRLDYIRGSRSDDRAHGVSSSRGLDYIGGSAGDSRAQGVNSSRGLDCIGRSRGIGSSRGLDCDTKARGDRHSVGGSSGHKGRYLRDHGLIKRVTNNTQLRGRGTIRVPNAGPQSSALTIKHTTLK